MNDAAVSFSYAIFGRLLAIRTLNTIHSDSIMIKILLLLKSRVYAEW